MIDIEAGHEMGDALLVDLGDGPGADLLAIAHDGDPFGDLHHFIEPV